MKTQNQTSAWTPGPWAVSMPGGQTTFNGRRVTVTARGSMIADLDWNSPKENMANARLIALAPEMAEVLRAVVDRFDNPTVGLNVERIIGAHTVAQARALLARLEGK